MSQNSNGNNNGNGNNPLNTHRNGQPTFVVPMPSVLRTDTPQHVEYLLNLIDAARVPNQVQVMLTPQCAQLLLTKQAPNQRKVSRAAVARLVTDYAAGQYLFTGDSIKFEVGGYGKDGQHRLTAQVEANVTVLQLVVFGLSPEALSKIDNGRSRTVTDMLNLAFNGDPNRITPTSHMVPSINLEFANFNVRDVRHQSRGVKVDAANLLSNEELAFLGAMSAAAKVGGIHKAGTLAGALRAYRRLNDPGLAFTITEFLAATFANQAVSQAYLPELSGSLYNYLNTASSAQGASQSAVYNQACAVVKTVNALLEDLRGELKLRAATNAQIADLTGQSE